MALPVLDGNQSATTLSSVVTGGEHIVAHSVVCLGSTAIANITSAVSGSVVSISNFPSTQTVAGTVTAYAVGKYAVGGPVFQDKNIATDVNGQTLINATVNAQSVFSYDGESHIFAKLTPNTTVTIGSLPAISGTVTANQFFTVVTSQTINFASSVTSTEAFNTGTDFDFVVIQTNLSNSGNLGTVYIDRYTSPTGSGGSSNFPLWDDTNKRGFTGGGGTNLCAGGNQSITLFQTGFPSQFYYRFRTADNTGGVSGSAKLYAIKSIYPYSANASGDIGKVPIAGNVWVSNSSIAISGTVTARLQDGSGNNLTSTTIGSSARLNVTLASATTTGAALPAVINVYGGSDGGTVRAVALDSSGRSVVTVSNFPATQPVSIASVTIGNSITIGSLPAISGTVTANGGDFVGEQSDAVAPQKIVQIGYYDESNEEFLRITQNSRLPVGSAVIEGGVKTDGDNIGTSAFAIAFDSGGTAKIPSEASPLPISGTVTVGNSVTIGSIPAISGTVTANAGSGTFNVSDRGTTGVATVTSITATTSVTLMASNSSRKVLTIYNEGAGNLHVLYGSGTATTANYSVKLFTGDYLEIDKYTGQVNAIFATAGTARVTEIT